MTHSMISYTFTTEIPLEDVEAALLLALLGTESLHGESNTRLEAPHWFDRATRKVLIDAATEPGRDLNRLFLGFVTRECGADSFAVERLNAAPKPANGPHPNGLQRPGLN